MMQEADVQSSPSDIKENNYPAHARTRIHHNVDDEWKGDPNQVEELLSRELYSLSLEDRNKFQDEIHGVRCIAPEETPEFLHSSLSQMEYELENVVPLDQKRAYLQSKTLLEPTYVHEDDFKLRFLRCELFDVPKAAVRMALFLDLLVDLFGRYALERPIKLSDFSKKELCEFRKGRLQFLPDRDRGCGSGRRIVCVFPDRGWAEIPARTRHKIAIYQFFVVGSDVDVQRKGIVLVAWFDSNLESSWKPMMSTKIYQIPSVRLSAVHICSPDTPYYRLRRSLAVMTAGLTRMRLRIHIGESMELRYILQGFGFPSEKLPITYSGTIKAANIKKWMRYRHLLEDEHYHRNLSGSISNGTGSTTIIDCPYLTDVLFRKGKNMTMNPGNAKLRSIMQSKIESGVFQTNENYKTRRFIMDIIKELKHHGRNGPGASNNPPIRLLEWDDANGNFWKEIESEDAIYNKIRHLVKEFQNKAKEQPTAKRKTQRKMVNQSGGTSIFNFQDGSSAPGGTPFGACISDCQASNKKKQKLNEAFNQTVFDW